MPKLWLQSKGAIASMSFSSIVIILALALILFGPEDLPKVARTIGKIVYQVRKATAELSKEFQSSLNEPLNNVARSYHESIRDAGKVVKTPLDTVADTLNKSVADVNLTMENKKESQELHTYDETTNSGEDTADPLAELPEDMVIQDDKGASR